LRPEQAVMLILWSKEELINFIVCIIWDLSGVVLYLRFQVHMAVKMSMLVFWVVTPCGLVGRYQRFGGTYRLHLQGWRRRQYDPPKGWYAPMSPHGVTTQKTNIEPILCMIKYIFVALQMLVFISEEVVLRKCIFNFKRLIARK
jgi:hypothetical protein